MVFLKQTDSPPDPPQKAGGLPRVVVEGGGFLGSWERRSRGKEVEDVSKMQVRLERP